MRPAVREPSPTGGSGRHKVHPPLALARLEVLQSGGDLRVPKERGDHEHPGPDRQQPAQQSWRYWGDTPVSLSRWVTVRCSLSSKSARVQAKQYNHNLLCPVQGQLVEDDSGSVLLPAKYDIANIHFWGGTGGGEGENLWTRLHNLREGQHPIL